MMFLFSLIPELTKEMLFFSAVSALGLFFLMIGWIFSALDGGFDFFDGDLDDISDVGDIDEIEGGSIGSNDIDIGGFSGDLPIPSFFSLKVLRIVMLCFGLGGNTGLRIGLDFYNSLILASFVGFLSGFIVYRAFIFIYKQTIYDLRDPQMVGRTGKVVLGIPAEGYGQVTIIVVGQRYTFRAISSNNVPIKTDTLIRVNHRDKGTCHVEILEE